MSNESKELKISDKLRRDITGSNKTKRNLFNTKTVHVHLSSKAKKSDTLDIANKKLINENKKLTTKYNTMRRFVEKMKKRKGSVISESGTSQGLQ